MNQFEKEAMDEYRREGPGDPLTWKHWVIVALLVLGSYIFATGLKTIFSL